MKKNIRKAFFLFLFPLSILASGAFSEYEYRAFAMGGNTETTKSVFELDGEKYTLVAYSTLNISFDDVSLDSEVNIIIPKLNDKQLPIIQLSNDYSNNHVVFKLFKSQTVFDESTLVNTTSEIYIGSNYTNIEIEL